MHRSTLIAVLFASVTAVLCGCDRDNASDGITHSSTTSRPGSEKPDGTRTAGQLRSQVFRERQTAGKSPRFQLLSPKETGVHFANSIDTTHPMKRLYHGGFVCGGVAVGDVDSDGRPDIYLVSGSGSNRLFRQTAGFRFIDITEKSGVAATGNWGAGAAMVDIDNDGDLDIYVCNYDSPNLLYINKGDGTFDERGKAFGLSITDACLMSAFADYDNDGDLDCYLLTNRYYREGGRPNTPPYKMRDGKPVILPEYRKFYGVQQTGPTHFDVDEIARPDRLLRNNGDGTFTDASADAGISRAGDYGLSVAWWDFNGDDLIDIYVGNDFNDPDHLYRNNGDGTFTDVLKKHIPHTSWFSMGSDAADINNDGRLDFLSVDMSATTHYKQKATMGAMSAERLLRVAGPPPQLMRNALYLNSGADRFMEIAYLAGLGDSDWSWSVKFGDLDNDGHIDVLITNGTARSFNHSDISLDANMLIGKTKWDVYEDSPPRPEQNLAFRNMGDLHFEDVSKSWGLDHVGMSYGAALSDLDRDGDLDAVVVNLEENVSIFRNDSAGNRVLIRLEGTISNRFGLGATVIIDTADGRQIRQLMPHNGFISSNEPLIHFGLGRQNSIKSLTVNWPSGHSQTIGDLEANRFYTITEPDDEAPQRVIPKQLPPMFARSRGLSAIRHQERPYDDFQRQPLLPNKLSQLGPGMAWGDVNGDGKDDLYIGGAAGQSGTTSINNGNGQFAPAFVGTFEEFKAAEDLGALFFDADGDGDTDLFVVAGGVEDESPRLYNVLQDRLYINNGDGYFSNAEGAIPEESDSGSVACAADFDRDGDLDLFVGGRSIPHRYPFTPTSHLLRNDNGKFTDIATPTLSKTGLVTSAVWSDADGDGWIDLLVTHEWGPVKVFRNNHGVLEDRTKDANLEDHLGWWNGIAARDVDNDGDIDYAVTNFGLNTKYHASTKYPVLLYYGDLDGTGSLRLVEAEFEGDVCFPIRGKSCSTHAMPFLKRKFPTYHEFALAPLEQIYTPQKLTAANKLAVNTLETGILINDGTARFTFKPLPRIAQASPSFGVVLTDVDADGNADLYLAQNFFSPQVETGRMDGGVSLLLLGNGDGTFREVWPDRSGLVVSGDAKALTSGDINNDGWVDFIVTVNNDETLAFANQGSGGNRSIKVKLRGQMVGSRVTVVLDDGSVQTAEVHAGGGYLSQSSSDLYFGVVPDRTIKRIDVRWSDGQTTHFTPDADVTNIVISR